MNRHRSIPQREVATFTIPFPGESVSYVSVGDEITFGQPLFEVHRKRLLDSFFLPEMLNIKANKAFEYVGRIAGEYVETGDLLAEKLTAAGMLGKRVVATQEGVIGMDRIALGYLDILGEEETYNVTSNVKGRVVGITLNSHMVVESVVGKIDFVYGNSLNNAIEKDSGFIVGEFALIADGSSVYTESSLKDSYDGQILYAGKFLYPKLAREVIKRGARCIITYAMDYEEMRNLDIPVVILGGFGQLPVNKELQALLQDCVGHLMKVDLEKPYLYISNKGGLNPDKYKGQMYFAPNLNVGDRVASIAADSYGVIGDIAEIYKEDDGNKALLDVAEGNNLILDARLLEAFVLYNKDL